MEVGYRPVSSFAPEAPLGVSSWELAEKASSSVSVPGLWTPHVLIRTRMGWKRPCATHAPEWIGLLEDFLLYAYGVGGISSGKKARNSWIITPPPPHGFLLGANRQSAATHTQTPKPKAKTGAALWSASLCVGSWPQPSDLWLPLLRIHTHTSITQLAPAPTYSCNAPDCGSCRREDFKYHWQ